MDVKCHSVSGGTVFHLCEAPMVSFSLVIGSLVIYSSEGFYFSEGGDIRELPP